jgi:hypothetical protein
MEEYMVPSGGDWSVHKSAAVIASGVRSFTIENCVFWSLGGNALLVSDYARSTIVRRNEFVCASLPGGQIAGVE